MKKSDRIFIIVITSLVIVLIAAISTMLVILFKPDDSTNDNISTNVSSEIESKPSKPASTDIVSSQAVSSNIVSKIESVPQITSSKNTVTSSIDTEKLLKDMQFESDYSVAEFEYLNDLKTQLPQYKKQYDDLQDEIDKLNREKVYKSELLREQYANYGLLGSGHYENALSNLKNSYDNKISSLSSQKRAIDNTIKSIESEINNPDYMQILAVVSRNNPAYTVDELLDFYDRLIAKVK